MKYTTLLLCSLSILFFIGCVQTDMKSNGPRETAPPDGQPIDEKQQEVFDILKSQDSFLFELGFNQCDTALLYKITSKDFEFYHDQSGITNSQQSFVQSIAGICKLEYKATRALEPNSLSVHLLRNNGKVYGAIQHGKHRFYGKDEGRPKYLTSTAEFTHLWLIEDNSWVLSRVLSYNHHSPSE